MENGSSLPVIINVYSLFIFSLLLLTLSVKVNASVSPSFPACYIAATQYEIVEGNTKYCGTSSSSCSDNGISYHFYCSEDHYCCWYDDCPACCYDEAKLNGWEITGIVIASVVVVASAILLAYCLAAKFCSKRPGS